MPQTTVLSIQIFNKHKTEQRRLKPETLTSRTWKWVRTERSTRNPGAQQL